MEIALEPSITIPKEAQSISIGADGTVSYTLPSSTTAQQAGQIQTRRFPESGGLGQHRPQSV